MRRVAGRP
jgi:DNA-binding FrmR family transcriptional regulator